jgi:hypothetical protein
MKKFGLTVVIAILFVLPVLAQNNIDNVHLFQSYFYDAPITKAGYGQGGLTFADYDKSNIFSLGVMGGYPLNEKLELGTQLHYLNISPDQGDSKSGISDLGVYGRYNVFTQDKTNISAGGMITLPIGSEDVLQGNFNFGGFGAIRHSLNNNMALVGTLGLIFYEKTEEKFNFNTFQSEKETSYDSYLSIAGGLVYAVNNQFNIVGELTIQTEGDYMLLSGGVDYVLGGGRLRGGLGIGLDDGAPDILLMGGYAISLSK